LNFAKAISHSAIEKIARKAAYILNSIVLVLQLQGDGEKLLHLDSRRFLGL